MTLYDYLRVGRARWKIILLGLLAGLLSAGAITWMTPREYSAQVTIYVSAHVGADTAIGAYQGNLLSEQKVKSYARLLTSKRIAQDVVNQLKLNVPAEDIAREITASSQPDTVLLTATATDRSQQRAMDIANATGDAFARLVAQLEKPSDALPAVIAAKVVEPAALPTSPVTPRPFANFGLGILLGLLAGYLAALARHALDTTVKSAEELQQLTEAPNLGTIGFDSGVPRHPLIVQDQPHSPRAEAFRKMRTNLQFIDVDRPRKTIVVTSSVPGEGKTTTLCNLAIVLAQAGCQVVVVETDLRQPRAADYLGLEGAVGVTSVLSGRVTLEQALQPWGSGTFDVLASGPIPPNPSELLASKQMTNLLADLTSRYSIVLLDAPPLLPVTDAAILSAACDGALVVVRHGSTTGQQIKTALSTLESVSATLLGTVLSMTPKSVSGSYYSKYYQLSRPNEPDAKSSTAPARTTENRRTADSLPRYRQVETLTKRIEGSGARPSPTKRL